MKTYPRIVFIVPSLKSGGAERVIVTLSNWLSREFHVEIWMMIDSQVEYALSDKVYLNQSYTSIKKGGIIRLFWLIKHLKTEKKTIVISFMTKLNLYAIIAAKLTGVKVIVSERNDPSKTIAAKYNYIRDLLYQFADKVVFQTEGAKDFFSNKVRENGVIILNPLRNRIPDLYEGKREKKIVTVSRLHPQKNLNLLIEAFGEFTKEYPDYSLVIYGEGPLESELKGKAKECKLQDKIIFAGVNENVLDLIQNAMMFIITSNFEGLSNALIEAMAIGLPCISTDSPPGGARMIIKDKINGLLVPVGDKNKLIAAMKKIVSNKEYAAYLGKNAAEIRIRVNEDTICSQWKQLILSI